VLHVFRRLTAMKIANRTLTINVITWTKIFLQDSSLLPILDLLSGMPYWMNINREDLNLALESIPIPLKGPIPPGISLQEAIQVNLRHNIHIRQHQNMVLHSNRYTISYTDIVQWITLLLISTSCVRKMFNSYLQMARSDAAEPVIISWSWMDRRWVQHLCVASISAQSAPVRYGRTIPFQIFVDQAVELRKKMVQESRARDAETLRRRRDGSWSKGASAPQ
jgi:hypothetical protein